MRVRMVADVDGAEKSIEAIVNNLKDLKPALTRLGNLLQLKAQRRFDEQGPGWPQLHQRSQERAAARSSSALEGKLRRDVSRAEKKAKKQSTIDRRKSVLEEFRRLERGGALDKSPLPAKQLQRLQERMARAASRGKRLLGHLARSIEVEVKAGSVRVYSTAEDYSAIHNDGGTAGHGAKIPARPFLVLDEEDLTAFEDFLAEALGLKSQG